MLHVFLNSAPHHVKTAIGLLRRLDNDEFVYYSKNTQQVKAIESLFELKLTSRLGLFLYILRSQHRHVTFHGLYDTTFTWFFPILSLIKNISVHFWGADLYPSRKKDFYWCYLKLTRVITFKFINVFLGLECDYSYFVKNYSSSSKFIFQVFPSKMKLKDVLLWSELPQTNYINKSNILVGNSADIQNNYLELLPLLKILQKRCDTKFKLVLNYGGTEEYKSCVIGSYNRSLKNVQFILNKLSISDYGQVVQESDIVIMGHNRQQAVGSITLAVAKRKIVLLKKCNPLLKQFQGFGFPVFDIDVFLKEYSEGFKMPTVNKFVSDKIELFTIEGAAKQWKSNYNILRKT